MNESVSEILYLKEDLKEGTKILLDVKYQCCNTESSLGLRNPLSMSDRSLNRKILGNQFQTSEVSSTMCGYDKCKRQTATTDDYNQHKEADRELSKH